MSDLSDTELIRQFQSGEIAAFEIFVMRHQDRLYRLACAFLTDSSDAEDAVQEVFIRAYKGFPRFRFRSKPFTWVYKILKNVCSELDKKRKYKFDNGVYENTYCDVSRQFEHVQELEKLKQSFSILSRRERDVVLLRVFEECNEMETATILGIKKGTVKSLLHRGLGKINKLYGKITD